MYLTLVVVVVESRRVPGWSFIAPCIRASGFPKAVLNPILLPLAWENNSEERAERCFFTLPKKASLLLNTRPPPQWN